MAELYDVIAVDLKSKDVRVLERNLTEANAEAYVNMAVVRRGVEEEIFAKAPAGRWHDGENWVTGGVVGEEE